MNKSQAEPADGDNAPSNGSAETTAPAGGSGEEDKMAFAGAKIPPPTAKIAPFPGKVEVGEGKVRLGFTRTNLRAYDEAPAGTFLFRK